MTFSSQEWFSARTFRTRRRIVPLAGDPVQHA
jgi:hypothetical protein